MDAKIVLTGLAEKMGYTPSKDLPKIVAERRKLHKAAWKQLNDQTLAHIGIALQADAETLSDEISRTGNYALLSKAKTKSQVREERYARRQIMKATIRKLGAETFELVRPEIERFIKAANGFVNELEAAEAKRARSFKVSFEASAAIRELRAAIARQADVLTWDTSLLGGHDPGSFLFFTPEL